MTLISLYLLHNHYPVTFIFLSQRVFTPKDFLDLSGRPQIGRVLAKLVTDEALVKLGYALYAKARKSYLTGAVIPTKSPRNLPAKQASVGR